MGLRHSNNIKLLRHGGGVQRANNIAVASAAPTTDAAAPPVAPNANSLAFDKNIMAQPVGSVGMINRIYEKHFPDSSKQSNFARDLDNRLDVPQLWMKGVNMVRLQQPSTTPDPNIDYVMFYHEVEKIMGFYVGAKGPQNFQALPSGGSRIWGNFGKYQVQLERWDRDKVRLQLSKDKRKICEMDYSKGSVPELSMLNGPLKGAVDAKFMALLGWSLVEQPELFESLLNLME